MEEKLYQIYLYPSTNYRRSFIVKAKDVHDALNKINYASRTFVKALKEKNKESGEEGDPYHKIKYWMDVVKCTRRRHRHHADRFGACFLIRYDAIEIDSLLNLTPLYGDLCLFDLDLRNIR